MNNVTERKCKYCNSKLPQYCKLADMCYNCNDKLPYVRKLIAIGNKIKRGDTK